MGCPNRIVPDKDCVEARAVVSIMTYDEATYWFLSERRHEMKSDFSVTNLTFATWFGVESDVSNGVYSPSLTIP